MRWPSAWKDPAALDLLSGTGIDCLLISAGGDLGHVADHARSQGLKVLEGPPAGTRLVKGDWTGIAASHAGGTSAGPTGEPWVDSNGWRVRLESALHPGSRVWVDAAPEAPGLATGAYALAVADAAASGARWIVTLDDELAASIAQRKELGMKRWEELTAATRFFARQSEWCGYQAQAVIGVISSFSGADEFLSHELLNLLARANQQYRVIPKTGPRDYQGLRAVLYSDAAAPDPGLRREMLAFAENGGLAIAGPSWGAPGRETEDPRWNIQPHGKGRVAVACAQPDDPYILANDSVVLVSHRYELLRFWNAGAVEAYLTRSGKQTVAHLVFYASQGPRDATVRVAGRYRSAALWTLDRAEPRTLELHAEKDGMEVHLPPVNQYAAIQLES